MDSKQVKNLAQLAFSGAGRDHTAGEHIFDQPDMVPSEHIFCVAQPTTGRERGPAQDLGRFATVDALPARKVGLQIANRRLFPIALPPAASVELGVIDAAVELQPSQRIGAQAAHHGDFVGFAGQRIRIRHLDRHQARVERNVVVAGPAIVDDLLRLKFRMPPARQRDLDVTLPPQR